MPALAVAPAYLALILTELPVEVLEVRPFLTDCREQGLTPGRVYETGGLNDTSLVRVES